MKDIYILQVKNFRKYPEDLWVNLFTITELTLDKITEFKVLIQDFVNINEELDIKKQNENEPMEFRFVKLKITDDIISINTKESDKFLHRLRTKGA